jgi:hypothetical protein
MTSMHTTQNPSLLRSILYGQDVCVNGALELEGGNHHRKKKQDLIRCFSGAESACTSQADSGFVPMTSLSRNFPHHSNSSSFRQKSCFISESCSVVPEGEDASCVGSSEEHEQSTAEEDQPMCSELQDLVSADCHVGSSPIEKLGHATRSFVRSPIFGSSLDDENCHEVIPGSKSSSVSKALGKLRVRGGSMSVSISRTAFMLFPKRICCFSFCRLKDSLFVTERHANIVLLRYVSIVLSAWHECLS